MENDAIALMRLKLNIENPNYEECYVDGYACGLASLTEESNPFVQDTVESEYWSDGWWDATYEQKPLFTLDGANVDSQPKAHEHRFSDFIVTFLEISGVIAVSTLLGYQLWELVA